MSLAYEAMMFAREVHQDQRRKYTGDPYVIHLAEVAGIVATAQKTRAPVRLSEMLAVAWLHDCMEDQAIDYGRIARQFGFLIAGGVHMLSDMEKGNRATRKAAARARLAKAADWVQTIKCADLISNTGSIIQHDPKFAVTYIEEARLLLGVLTEADPRLHALALAGIEVEPVVGPSTQSETA